MTLLSKTTSHWNPNGQNNSHINTYLLWNFIFCFLFYFLMKNGIFFLVVLLDFISDIGKKQPTHLVFEPVDLVQLFKVQSFLLWVVSLYPVFYRRLFLFSIHGFLDVSLKYYFQVTWLCFFLFVFKKFVNIWWLNLLLAGFIAGISQIVNLWREPKASNHERNKILAG